MMLILVIETEKKIIMMEYKNGSVYPGRQTGSFSAGS